MEIREIHGMYYDKEKKRYFAIRATAIAGAAYSSGDVKRRKIQDEKQELQERQLIIEKARIQRTKYSSRPLLEREYGNNNLEASSVVLQGYQSADVIQRGLESGSIFALQSPPENTEKVDVYITDNQRVLVSSRKSLQPGEARQGGGWIHHISQLHLPDFGQHFGGVTATSICTNAASRQFAATFQSPRGGCGVLIGGLATAVPGV